MRRGLAPGAVSLEDALAAIQDRPLEAASWRIQSYVLEQHRDMIDVTTFGSGQQYITGLPSRQTVHLYIVCDYAFANVLSDKLRTGELLEIDETIGSHRLRGSLCLTDLMVSPALNGDQVSVSVNGYFEDGFRATALPPPVPRPTGRRGLALEGI
jgi:hypothetical protein